jgi:hypothetical protein
VTTIESTAYDRYAYQHRVDELLEQIRLQVREVRLLAARGVRPRGLAERKRDLARARQELAALVGRRPGRAGGAD